MPLNFRSMTRFINKISGRQRFIDNDKELRSRQNALMTQVEQLASETIPNLNKQMKELADQLVAVKDQLSNQFNWLHEDVLLPLNHEVSVLKKTVLDEVLPKHDRMSAELNWLHKDIILTLNHRVDEATREVEYLKADLYRVRQAAEVGAEFYEIRLDNVYFNLNKLMSQFPDLDAALTKTRSTPGAPGADRALA